jgi:hypothetical protein
MTGIGCATGDHSRETTTELCVNATCTIDPRAMFPPVNSHDTRPWTARKAWTFALVIHAVIFVPVLVYLLRRWLQAP